MTWARRVRPRSRRGRKQRLEQLPEQRLARIVRHSGACSSGRFLARMEHRFRMTSARRGHSRSVARLNVQLRKQLRVRIVRRNRVCNSERFLGVMEDRYLTTSGRHARRRNVPVSRELGRQRPRFARQRRQLARQRPRFGKHRLVGLLLRPNRRILA
jgi:hypothetical protein